VDEDDRGLAVTLYGVAANADWIQYGPPDPLVSLVTLEAPAEDEARIGVRLSRPVWGYRTRWVGTDLLLEIRRPPVVADRHPLRGRVVAIDPGHPPAGARGPSGAYEGDVTLAVGRAARDLFEAAGARAVLLRDDTLPLSLADRTRGAEAAGAELLISIHANALPDGVNPFVNSGTSSYYYQPRSAPFARAVNAALVRRLGFRDLGVGRGDLALVRPTWMPSVLTEGLFMMLPDQEAVLTSPAGQRAYARALVEGTEAFLAWWVSSSR
jgi:N-acetylmuramoyl-L-alanine amidase